MGLAMYALVINGCVVDTAPAPFPVSANFKWEPCGPDVAAGWVFGLGGFSRPETDPPLSDVKLTYSRRVDADAEACRLRYITGGSGMALTYQEKFAQAQAVSAMGETLSNALSKQDREAQFPTLSASVGIEADTIYACAQLVLARYAQFAQISLVIERARLSGKLSVAAAHDVAGAIAAYEAIAWPTP